jgi:hypothetical protein
MISQMSPGEEKDECGSHCWDFVRSFPSGVSSFMVDLATLVSQGKCQLA